MDPTAALLAGLLAGMAIAMQFGAISALLLDSAITAGQRAGVAAGLGIATVDIAYAAVAVVAGGAARSVLAGHEPELRAAAAVTLALIAVRGLGAVIRDRSPSDPARAQVEAPGPGRASATAHYVRFLALTGSNPQTVVYFASVATSVSISGFAARAAFVIGAGGASCAWQLLLALAAGYAGRRLTPPVRRAVAIAGRLAVLGVAVRFALTI